MNFTLRQLLIFATIAKTQNVSQAAQLLFLSQSAASSALVELERSYQKPLFDRIGKSLQLNATGRALLPLVENLLAEAQQVDSFLTGAVLAPLHLGATLTIGNYLASQLIKNYLDHYPNAKVQLSIDNTEHIVQKLLRFECDIALLEGEVSHPDLMVEPWLTDELVVFVASQHPLSQLSVVDKDILSQQTWVLREPGSSTRRLFDQNIGCQLGSVQISLELNHTEAIKHAVRSGLGLGCLSRLALGDEVKQGLLHILPTPAFNLQRQFYLVRHKQRQLGQAGEGFCGVCWE